MVEDLIHKSLVTHTNMTTSDLGKQSRMAKDTWMHALAKGVRQPFNEGSDS